MVVWSLVFAACVLRGPDVPGPADAGVVIDTAVTAHTGMDSAETAESADTGDTPGTVDTAAGDTSAGETGETAAGDTAPVVPRTGPIVLYAVRHCEKDDEEDPGLTEEGQARAQALAELMAAEPLAAIYATELRRTQETVQPTADDHGLPVITDIDPEEDLAAWILANHDNQTVLHAGHSYTLPDLMEALGVTDDFDVDGYGQLWTVTIAVDGAVTLDESTFGE